ncbi:MAG TPA: formylglycine-generating enzyme family protein [Polyangiaceae bacterium]|nr:formylglycine-generating enzyme family protein [Polyangiaceae bacterium]
MKADCEDGWCRVPAGCFVIGSPLGEWHRGALTEDQKAVTLTHAFNIQQTEMTRAQWRDITAVETSPTPQFACLEDDCPVTMVTWWEAVLAANMLSEKEGLPSCYQPYGCTGELGKGRVCEGFENANDSLYDCLGYRLPTRAESEYSARAGTTTAFYSGDILERAVTQECSREPNLDRIAWYCHNSEGKPHRVALLEPNGFGLYDQLGNVEELLNDVEYWASSPGGTDPEGMVSRPDAQGVASSRVIRGGRVDLQGWLSRAANRSDSRWNAYGEYRSLIGFRLVRSLPK